MANSTLSIDVIAKEALMHLDNNLVAAKLVHRGHESDFGNAMNGYEAGDAISIRRPADFTVRDGATAANQDVVEGKVSLTVDKQKGIDFGFTSKELTLEIKELSERVIKPAMIQLANQVDRDVLNLYKQVPNWVGSTGQTINSFADFAKAPERLDEFAVPMEGRAAILSPADHWALLGSQTALYMQDVAKGAYRNGSLGMIGGVDTYMSQNVPVHTTGSDVTTVTVNQALTSATTTYASVKDTMEQTITIAGGNLNAGDVITIADVNAVNPVTKADLGFAKQFTVVSYSSNTLVVSPALIWDGPFQNVQVASGVTDLNTKAITAIGAAGATNRANLVFHRNAFALAMVPMVAPPGAPQVSRQSYKGTSVRLIPTYDGTNDRSNFRLDVLYGVKAIDPRLATRLSGSA
jgi:ribosomal 50S subunit-recycling heat shock protein